MRIRRLWVVMVVGFVGPAGLVGQFPPERAENLQVLPADTPVRQIIGVMRGFALGLGVRCEHCHVGEPGADLSTFDFVSDEKETKAKARAMLRMVQAINDSHLADLPGRSNPPVPVTCATCHHGVTVPLPLEDVLMAEAQANGVGAALDRYEALRQQYYGGYSYDFSEGTLVSFAQGFRGGAEPADLVKILQRNLELFPTSVQTLVGLGQAHDLAGDKATAIEMLERAVELAPDAGFVRQVLQRIRGSERESGPRL